MSKEKNYYKEPFDAPSFLDQEQLNKQEAKIKSGEITCNPDTPEECEACGA
tara:strand:- start:82 stop:234 length:153 start_codon:yes stop_codon:yes gene_type:complete